MIAAVRLIGRMGFTVACIALLLLLMTLTWCLRLRPLTRRIMQGAFITSAWVWGIRIRVQGTLATSRPLMLVSNHFSYLDLFVLGSKVPVAFTPKTEIRSWPVLGFMCMVAGCLFIDRRPAKTMGNKRLVENALESGEIISLFPEGTTNDGTAVLPFKSSLFSIALERGMQVQPVSVLYTQLNGHDVTPKDYPVIGWYGDSYFFPHMVQYMKQRGVEAVLKFHPPVSAKDFASRKELALHCHEAVERGMR